MTKRAHVIGAGLAGLSAAVRLAEAGYRPALWEAGPQAGGRCRSYFDEVLGCRIDNGNHLLLSGNKAARDYLTTIGAGESLAGPETATFPFIDLATSERWTLSLGGRLPLWLFDAKRRVPGTGILDYLTLWRFLRVRGDQTVRDLVGDPPILYRRFWQPLAVAVLNTEAEAGAARLLTPVLRETFLKGADSCRPLIAREGLSESFVDPALAWLGLRGARFLTGARVRGLTFDESRVTGFEAGSERIEVGPDEPVILAVPPGIAASLVPGLTVPHDFRPIVNAHFVLPEAAQRPGVEIVGVIGGTTEWIFRRGNLASVTISAATHVIDESAEDLAPRLWDEVARVLDLGPLPLPPWRIVKEKRATFAQTPAQLARRPGTRTKWRNLMLAGDWTDTGLPATIEGAIRSGVTAAAAVGRPE
jgi:squalene-associated FAD-dependent desaturase